MTTHRLVKPRIALQLEQPDGQLAELVVQTDNRDYVRWDMTRNRKQWPELQAAPFLGQTFLAWAALTRAGDLPDGESFEDFQERCLHVQAITADGDAATDEDDLTVGPTRTDHGSVS